MPKSDNGSYYDMKYTYIFSSRRFKKNQQIVDLDIFSRYTTDAGKYERDSKEYSSPGIDRTSDKESKTFYEGRQKSTSSSHESWKD